MAEYASVGAFPEFKHSRNTSLLKIFMGFMTKDIVNSVMSRWEKEVHLKGSYRNATDKRSARQQYFNFDIKTVYQVIAMHIRVIGLQDKPVEGRRNVKPLGTALREAKAHFESLGACNVPCLRQLLP